MAPPEVHFEPFLHLAGLADDEALIAWGGFWFRRNDADVWQLVDDEDLTDVTRNGRRDSIGARSQPFGDAVVEVERDGRIVARAQTGDRNHAWVGGLEPDTEYRYRVVVDGRPWADGERLDWDPDERTLKRSGRHYDNRFRTFPAPATLADVRFAVLGDFGVGVLRRGEDSDRQMRLARALERAVEAHDARLVLTVGDNVYLGSDATVTGTGNEDDDWYGSFYQPYRYVLNRVPFFPTVGNHDASDTERSDDRQQLSDNYFIEQRFRPAVESGRASVDPGLFYRFGVGALCEFICIDTSLATGMGVEHYFDDPAHIEWVRRTLEPVEGMDAVGWRIPFSHHPPYCAGPHHGNTTGMVERLVPLFEQTGVRLVLSGHEHNFQHATVNGIDYVVSGAGGKLRPEPPKSFEDAGTRAWASAGHFLLVDVRSDGAAIHPVGDVRDDGTLELIDLVGPDGAPVDAPITVPW